MNSCRFSSHFLAGLSQEANRRLPFFLGWFDVTDEPVQVARQADHDLPQPPVGALFQTLDRCLRDLVFDA